MGQGTRLGVEQRWQEDSTTGLRIRQLTNYRGNSYHLYFTNSGWHAGDRRLVFGSDRDNRTNLYDLELESGEITQLTDFDTKPLPGGGSVQNAILNPTREEAYFWHDGTLLAVNLENGDTRELYRPDEGMLGGNNSVTADGASVVTQVHEDLSDRIRLDLGHGYVGFRELWEAKPLCRVMKIDTETGKAESVHEERCWVGHVNTSTTRPELATFCHEGPWNLVDQRMWGLDISTGRTWKLREQAPAERVGHEYWFEDGIHIGYQGWDEAGDHFYGSIRYDDTERLEVPFPHGSSHFHSNDLSLVVGDGSKTRPELLLWRFAGEGFEGPKLVTKHRGSFHCQDVHVHPRFSPDGRQILYCSDAAGYGNLYLVDVPDFDKLPDADPV